MHRLAALRKQWILAFVLACVFACVPVPALASEGFVAEQGPAVDAPPVVVVGQDDEGVLPEPPDRAPIEEDGQGEGAGIEVQDEALPTQGDARDLAVESAGTEDVVVTAQDGDAPKPPVLRGNAFVQETGWQENSKRGAGILLGSSKGKLRLEALKLDISRGSVSYKAYVQEAGWSAWERNGGQAGHAGADRRIEALRLRLSSGLSATWSLQYRVRVWSRGWMGWASDGAPAGTTGFEQMVCALEVRVVPVGTALPQSDKAAYLDAGLTANGYVQTAGWRRERKGYDVTIGSTGKGRRLEALTINRPGLDLSGGIVYRAHVQRIGWQEAVRNGAVAGLPGQGLRMEAIKIKLTGQLAASYDVWYRLHVQGLGWLAWASNWQKAGTEGLSLRVEALQVALVPKGQRAPAVVDQSVGVPFVKRFNASYRAMVGGKWSAWKTSGSVGKGGGPAINALSARLPDGVPAKIQCSAHLSRVGWTNYLEGGRVAGSSRSTVEAVRMRLVGAASRVASVWYRVYVHGVGWTCWARDGAPAGSVAKSLPIDALQVRVVPNGGDAPSDESAALAYACVDANSPQLRKDANRLQKRLLSAVATTPWPGKALCAGWVTSVFANAGFGMVYGNANDLYAWYCKSSRQQQLKAGMIVAVSTHTRSIPGKRWGHVGIYVGDGWVVHSVNAGVIKLRLSDWVERYGTTVPPKWGWLGNAALA